MRVNYPDSAPAGQSLRITTMLTASCDPGGQYTIRVDLVDASNSKVLSSATDIYYSSSSSYTTSLVNEAIAPTNVGGSWVLEVQGYVFFALNGQTAASSAQHFSIKIVPYIPPTTTAQTTASVVFSSSASEVTSARLENSVPVQVTQVISSSTEDVGGGTLTQAIVGCVIAFTILGIAAYAVLRSRRRAREHTVVY
jgi:hypothetical protein